MRTRYISFELATLFISLLVYLSFILTCIEFYWFSSPSWNQAVWIDLITLVPASNVIFLLEKKRNNKVCTVHTMFDVIFRCRLVEHQTYLIKKSDSIRLLCKHLETMTDQFSQVQWQWRWISRECIWIIFPFNLIRLSLSFLSLFLLHS